MTQLKKRQISFYISFLTLLSAFVTLAWVGWWEWNKKHKPQFLHLEPIPFGVSVSQKYAVGRDSSISSLWNDLPEFSKELVQKCQIAILEKDSLALSTLSGELIRRHGDTPLIHWLKANFYLSLANIPLSAKWDGFAPNSDKKLIQSAHAHISKALKSDAGHPQLLNLQGKLYWALEKYSEAAASWELAVQLAPQMGDVWFQLGRIYRQQEKYSKSNMYLRTAYTFKYPQAQKEATELALLFYESGKLDSARKLLAWAEEKKWSSDTLKWVKGLLLEQQGHLESAQIVYEDLLAKEPANLVYLQSLETLGQKSNRNLWVEANPTQEKNWEKASEAVEILDPLVKMYPQNAPLWWALGKAYLKSGLLGHGIRSLDTALLLDSTLVSAKSLRDSALEKASLFKKDLTQSPDTQEPADQEGYLITGEDVLAKNEITKKVGNLNGQISDQAGTDIKKHILKRKDGFPQNTEMNQSRVMLGHYLVHWDSYKEDVWVKYGKTELKAWKDNFLRQTFSVGSHKHDYVLGFKEGKLWGMGIYISDTLEIEGNLLQKLQKQNYSFSGQGTEINKRRCGKYREFQGTLWQTEDTIELMGSFSGTPSQVRMVRLKREHFATDPSICQLVSYLDKDQWGNPN